MIMYREAGRMGDLCTVGTFHQCEGEVSTFLLIGFFADLTDSRQRKARLDGTDDRTHHTNKNCSEGIIEVISHATL